MVKPAPCAISAPFSDESEATVTGVSSRPRPAPRKINPSCTSSAPLCGVRCPSMNWESAKTPSPSTTRFGGCIKGFAPFKSRPHSMVPTMVATPPGRNSRPVWVGEKPRMLCTNSGRINTLP